MSTFGEIRSRVEEQVRDLPPHTLAAIPGFINAASHKLQQEHSFRCMQTSVELVTVPSTAILGTVDDFKAPRDRPYRTDPDGTATLINYESSLALVVTSIPGSADGPPQRIYWADATTFLAYPKSDGRSLWGDGQYRVTLPYWRYLPKLSAPSDTDWFTLNADDYLVYHAAAFASFLNLDPENATTLLGIAQQFARTAIKVDGLSTAQQTTTLRYSTGSA